MARMTCGQVPAMDAFILSQENCRLCGEQLVVEASQKRDAAVMERCGRCGYINVFRDQTAPEQIDIRAHWRRLWSQLCEGEAAPPSATLIKVIVTSEYLPPFLFDRYPDVPITGLKGFLERNVGAPLPKAMAQTTTEELA